MTSLAIAKLVSDALLFASLLFLSFKVLRKHPGNNINFAKLKELELSLKEVVKQADEASQNFNEELLTRRRDLEKVLTDATSIEAKLSKTDTSLDEAIREAVLAKKDLERAVEKSIEEFSQLKKSLSREAELERSKYLTQESTEPSRHSYLPEETEPQYFTESAHSQAEQAPRAKNHSRLSKGKEIISASQNSNFEYSTMLEPPSFSQIAEVTEKRVTQRVDQNSILNQMIEKSIEPSTLRKQSQPKNTRRLQDSLQSVAESAERSIEATRLPDHLEEALSINEQSSNKTIVNDPRLGVLGGQRRTSQVI